RRRPRPRRRQAACSCPGPQDPEGRRGRHGGGARASLAAAGHAGQAPGPDVRHLDAREGRGRGSRGRRAHARLVLQVCGEGAGGGPGRGGGRGRAGGRRRRRGGGRGAGRDGLRGASPRPPSLTSCCDHLRARYPYVCKQSTRAPELGVRRGGCLRAARSLPGQGPPDAQRAACTSPAPASARPGRRAARPLCARAPCSRGVPARRPPRVPLPAPWGPPRLPRPPGPAARGRSPGPPQRARGTHAAGRAAETLAAAARGAAGGPPCPWAALCVGTDMAAARGAPGALAPRRPRPLELAGCPAVCAARWAVDTFSVHCLWP
ncbi:unnamed protein product, partial [Prorocentrum cordatum]